MTNFGYFKDLLSPNLVISRTFMMAARGAPALRPRIARGAPVPATAYCATA